MNMFVFLGVSLLIIGLANGQFGPVPPQGNQFPPGRGQPFPGPGQFGPGPGGPGAFPNNGGGFRKYLTKCYYPFF